MKLPKEITKKVRDIIATRLQCPGYKINEKDLYEIKKICDYYDELQAKLLLSESQNYCKICGNILDGYIPPKEKK